MNDHDALIASATADFAASQRLSDWEQVKARYLGKSGQVTALMAALTQLPAAEKKVAGQTLNALKQRIEAISFTEKKRLEAALLEERLNAEAIDITLPGRKRGEGGLHPITRSWRRLETIFGVLGFSVAEGPEIENDWFNFSALNNPDNHPARSMQDTFYLEHRDRDGKPFLLRTHTSPMQIRFARAHQPPFRIIAPGRTYRVDSDATHSPMFHQIEGLWVDESISFADLKGVYLHFIAAFFAPQQVEVRFRPSYFPFTEPSAEIDIRFNTGPLRGRWLEVSGSGQVHPQVIRNMGFDPERYQGFAFGSGIERLTMLRYGIDDLRLFYSNHLDFLAQFQN